MRTGAARGRPFGDLARQYLDLRHELPGVIILFRVGSFYVVLDGKTSAVGMRPTFRRPTTWSAIAMPATAGSSAVEQRASASRRS